MPGGPGDHLSELHLIITLRTLWSSCPLNLFLMTVPKFPPNPYLCLCPPCNNVDKTAWISTELLVGGWAVGNNSPCKASASERPPCFIFTSHKVFLKRKFGCPLLETASHFGDCFCLTLMPKAPQEADTPRPVMLGLTQGLSAFA